MLVAFHKIGNEWKIGSDSNGLCPISWCQNENEAVQRIEIENWPSSDVESEFSISRSTNSICWLCEGHVQQQQKSNNDLKKILFKFRTNHVVMRSPYIYIMLDTIIWSVQCSWLKYHIRWNIDPWKLLPCFVHHTQKNRIIDKVTRIQLEIVRHLPVKTFGNWSKLWKWK